MKIPQPSPPAAEPDHASGKEGAQVARPGAAGQAPQLTHPHCSGSTRFGYFCGGGPLIT